MIILRWLAAVSVGLALLFVGLLIKQNRALSEQNQNLRLQVEQLAIQRQASDSAMAAASRAKQEAGKINGEKEEQINEASRDNPDFYDQLLPESVLRLLRQDGTSGGAVHPSGRTAHGH